MPADQMAEVLGHAEEIINAVAPEALAEARAEDAKREKEQGGGRKWWRRRR